MVYSGNGIFTEEQNALWRDMVTTYSHRHLKPSEFMNDCFTLKRQAEENSACDGDTPALLSVSSHPFCLFLVRKSEIM